MKKLIVTLVAFTLSVTNAYAVPTDTTIVPPPPQPVIAVPPPPGAAVTPPPPPAMVIPPDPILPPPALTPVSPQNIVAINAPTNSAPKVNAKPNKPANTGQIAMNIKQVRNQIEAVEKDILKLQAKITVVQAELEGKRAQLKNIDTALDLINKLFDPDVPDMEKLRVKTEVEKLIGNGFKLNVNNVAAVVTQLQGMKTAREAEIKALEKKLLGLGKALEKLQERKDNLMKKLVSLHMLQMAIMMGISTAL